MLHSDIAERVIGLPEYSFTGSQSLIRQDGKLISWRLVIYSLLTVDENRVKDNLAWEAVMAVMIRIRRHVIPLCAVGAFC